MKNSTFICWLLIAAAFLGYIMTHPKKLEYTSASSMAPKSAQPIPLDTRPSYRTPEGRIIYAADDSESRASESTQAGQAELDAMTNNDPLAAPPDSPGRRTHFRIDEATK